MKAIDKLRKKIKEQKHICVGLDTDINKIPLHLQSRKNAVIEFNKLIIEYTKENCAAYKINFAFYECRGLDGIKELEATIKMIPEDILIIADAKRGDIGNTSRMYASAVFDYYNCDAITLHPYMGSDSISPFLKYEDKLNFILALTSNKGANDFEKQELRKGGKLFQLVIKKTVEWNTSNNCGFVVGATQPEELEENIDLLEKLPVLLPGVGAQGGDMEEIVRIFQKNIHNDFLINISRGLIYADSSENFAKKAGELLIDSNNKIMQIINN
ncbi:MAG: orotidine-5'-phosphate decarboxylase [Ignavibacteria bacterium]|jgi:orotidine-5'-phosphate decarboxylase